MATRRGHWGLPTNKLTKEHQEALIERDARRERNSQVTFDRTLALWRAHRWEGDSRKQGKRWRALVELSNAHGFILPEKE